MKTINYLFFCTALLCMGLDLNAQVQIGNSIDGEAANDFSGSSVCMPDTNTVAIAATGNDGINGDFSGHVRVYELSGDNWIQKGQDIDGEAMWDLSGESISMPDGNTIAISSAGNDGNGAESGHVRVFRWDGNTWVQKGQDIDGDSAGFFLGISVSMPDVNTLAIGMGGNNGLKGLVRMYQWDGSNWVQKGQEIEGEANEDRSSIVNMPDENTVAIGAPTGSPNGATFSGYVRIFRWNGNSWVQKGQTIAGEAEKNLSGGSISMPDSNTIAIGAPENTGVNGGASGHVRIYEWNGSNWIQKGQDIDGEGPGDRSGGSVSMPNANTVAIGAEGYYSAQNKSGQVRVYEWNGSNWTQKGQDIDGEQILSNFGASVSMPDANTLAAGAPNFDGNNGEASGNVRVFSILGLGVNDLNIDNQITVYPNPAQDYFQIKTERAVQKVTIYNMLGKTVAKFNPQEKYNVPDLKHGIYFVSIRLNNKTINQKILID